MLNSLLAKQKEVPLTNKEEQELSEYENLDDYLSLINRLIRGY